MEIVLNTFGTMLNCENGCFSVSNENGRKRIPTDGIRSILASKGVSITSDAIMLAIDNGIEIHFIDRKGDPKGLVWSHTYGSISTIRKGQLTFSQSPQAVEWIKEMVATKIENQEALLMMTTPKSDNEKEELDDTLSLLENFRTKVLALEGNSVRDIAQRLRGLEGSAAKFYFAAMSDSLPEEYRFGERSQHPARDVVNAMLNYGYGLLYGKIESALIRAGIDPYVGVFHRDNYNRPVLVYDVIERFRVWVDYVVFALACQRVVTDEYYSVGTDGSVWLENLGRRVIIQSINDYLDEVVVSGNKSQSRLTLISNYAHQLASTFKKL